MAEGLLRHLAGDRFEATSAGTEATSVRPLAIRAMEEIGIDISGQESKTLDRYLSESFDHVITVCDDANEACPFFPGGEEQASLVLTRSFASQRFGRRAPRGLPERAKRASESHRARAHEPVIACMIEFSRVPRARRHHG